jgi:hypothetical protein
MAHDKWLSTPVSGREVRCCMPTASQTPIQGQARPGDESQARENGGQPATGAESASSRTPPPTLVSSRGKERDAQPLATRHVARCRRRPGSSPVVCVCARTGDSGLPGLLYGPPETRGKRIRRAESDELTCPLICGYRSQ